jgi:hypothetical protein
LYGYKYFTSATTADVTFTLAKIKGSDALSLFVVKLRDDSGMLNNMLVHRLKDKLGTRYAYLVLQKQKCKLYERRD